MTPRKNGLHEATLEKTASFFISHLVAALRNSLIYTPAHSQVEYSLKHAEDKAREALAELSELVFVCIEKDVLFSGKPMNKSGLHFVKLAEFMQSMGIQRLVFLPGVTAQEMRQFIQSAISITHGDGGEDQFLASSKCIKVGRLAARRGAGSDHRVSHGVLVNLMVNGALTQQEIAQLEATGSHAPGKALESLDMDLLKKARDAVSLLFDGVVSDKALLQEGVKDFVHHFLQYAESVFPLRPLKDHDELTFTHSVNVALLCAAQAHFIDSSPEVLKNIALAGLYHDYGKMRIPPEVLNKPTPLTSRERKMIADHCLSGARILSRHPRIPRIAAVAAYEHHMHYSGQSGYPRSTRDNAPFMVSQMVTLADFFDAALTEKPYRPARNLIFVLDLLKKRSGSQFNPLLVNIFAKVVRTFTELAS